MARETLSNTALELTAKTLARFARSSPLALLRHEVASCTAERGPEAAIQP
jgi:hypothetical protein